MPCYFVASKYDVIGPHEFQLSTQKTMHTQAGAAFIADSIHYLAKDYLPKIQRCLTQLSEEDLWWRPNESSNSVGNLVLHLSGNLRQWIVSGVGDEEDIRERQKEFDERGPLPKVHVAERLANVVHEACDTLRALNPETLLDTRTIQGNEVTKLQGIYHAVEHFSTHTGQIIYITKMRNGKDLTFYKVNESGIATPNW